MPLALHSILGKIFWSSPPEPGWWDDTKQLDYDTVWGQTKLMFLWEKQTIVNWVSKKQVWEGKLYSICGEENKTVTLSTARIFKNKQTRKLTQAKCALQQSKPVDFSQYVWGRAWCCSGHVWIYVLLLWCPWGGLCQGQGPCPQQDLWWGGGRGCGGCNLCGHWGCALWAHITVSAEPQAMCVLITGTLRSSSAAVIVTSSAVWKLWPSVPDHLWSLFHCRSWAGPDLWGRLPRQLLVFDHPGQFHCPPWADDMFPVQAQHRCVVFPLSEATIWGTPTSSPARCLSLLQRSASARSPHTGCLLRSPHPFWKMQVWETVWEAEGFPWCVASLD